jgi:hypothetical protein
MAHGANPKYLLASVPLLLLLLPKNSYSVKICYLNRIVFTFFMRASMIFVEPPPAGAGGSLNERTLPRLTAFLPRRAGGFHVAGIEKTAENSLDFLNILYQYSSQ